RGMPSLGPGSWRLGVAALRNPKVYTPAAAVSAWLPVGLVSNDSIKDVVRRVVAKGWTAHPNTWIVACDYETGRRVPFGRERAPEVAELLQDLPAGQPHKLARPAGDPSTWPPIGPAAAEAA